MRFFTFSMVSAMFVGLAACNGGGAEDCSDNVDNDGDAAVDCDDSECATDPACEQETGGNETGTTDVEDCHDGDQNTDPQDEDGDGDINCADSDCFGPGCHVALFTESGSATVTASSWDGDSNWTWGLFDGLADIQGTPASTCVATGAGVGVEHNKAADCDNCDFALQVTFTGSVGGTGAGCATLPDTATFDPATMSYGYGFNPAYAYNNTTYELMMAYSPPSGTYAGGWYPLVYATATNVNGQFDYEWPLGGYYY